MTAQPMMAVKNTCVCITACKVENIGNAVNTASATVISGTSAMVVVKVRLLAQQQLKFHNENC